MAVSAPALSTEPASEHKTYHGSCHCGFIKYTADLIISPETLTKCNCTYCLKSNFLLVKDPNPDLIKFKLLSPASLDEIDGKYLFASKEATFYHCKNCGVQTFITCVIPTGKTMVCINVVTLDDVDLSEMKVKRYWNCRFDNIADYKLGEKPSPPGVI